MPAPAPTSSDLTQLAEAIHQDNRKAGWWTDLTTGESTLASRNRPEMLMLVVSELAEAAEGIERSLWDDKLPDLPMFDVELADAAIRLMDLLGAEGRDFGPSPVPLNFSPHMSSFAELMLLVCLISTAMEHYRKGRRDLFLDLLEAAVWGLFQLAALYQINLPEVISRKRAFNAQREDHKLSSRKAEGGKAF